MDQRYDNYNYAPGYTGTEDSLGLAFLGIFAAFAIFFAVIVYVVNAIFLMKLLKNAGHATPGSAWVPIWNQVSLAQIGGIKQPWIWMLVLFAGGFVSGLIPVVGIILTLVLTVASIILMVYIAKGVQAGLGIESIGGIVLAVIVPLAWIIWMAVASGKRKNYDRDAALREGGSLPLNWFGESDRLAPFGAPTNSYAYSQQSNGSTPNYQQPQGNQHYSAPGFSGGWNPGAQPQQQGYEQPQAPVYGQPQAPATRGYEPPVAPQSNRDDPESNGDGSNSRPEDGLPRI